MDTPSTTDQSSILPEELSQGELFQIFDQAIEMAEERAKWEIPVAKPTER